MEVERERPLSALTTLELGGPAEAFVRVERRATLLEALRWADSEGLPARVLGGGSNLVVGDEGVRGLVIQLATRGLRLETSAGRATLTVEAGEPWQSTVDAALEADLAGVECLTGIPGLTGATPIQNVGAYGQEVAQVIERVEVLDRRDLRVRWLRADQCGFGYRDSRFKRAPERFVVLAVRMALRPGGAPTLRYGELSQALSARARPSLREVADAVYALRAAKSMVIDPSDPNHRSAGSFFTNPVVDAAVARRVVDLALARGWVDSAAQVPRYAVGDGRVKLAAAWLIERTGLGKGTRRGAVGISAKHALGLVHHGGGTTRELIDLAREVRARVKAEFGITLHAEPTFWNVSGW